MPTERQCFHGSVLAVSIVPFLSHSVPRAIQSGDALLFAINAFKFILIAFWWCFAELCLSVLHLSLSLLCVIV